MKFNIGKIIQGELIGVKVKVIDSKNKSNVGVHGKITHETKKTLTIGDKMMFKNNITLQIGNLKVRGEKLLGRPEERIKFKVKI